MHDDKDGYVLAGFAWRRRADKNYGCILDVKKVYNICGRYMLWE